MLRLGEFIKLIEDGQAVAVNNAGGGNVAGLGIGPQGEPGVKRKPRKKKAQIRGVLSAINLEEK